MLARLTATVVAGLVAVPNLAAVARGQGCPAAGVVQSGAVHLQLSADERAGVLSNGFVCAVVGESALLELRSDFHGQSNWGANALAAPLGLELVTADGSSKHAISTNAALCETTESSTERRTLQLTLTVPQIAEETWTLSVGSRERNVSVSIRGRSIGKSSPPAGAHLRHTFAAVAVSTFVQTQRGAMQMMNKSTDRTLYTNDALIRAYWLGAKDVTKAARVIPKPFPIQQLPSLDVTVLPDYNTSLLAIETQPDSHATPFGGALHDVVLGAIVPFSVPLDAWTNASRARWRIAAETGAAESGLVWSRGFALTPNNYDFPAGSIPVGDSTAGASGVKEALKFEDLRAFYTAIYASPAGQLISFFPATPGMSQTSLHSPHNGYAGLVNFFDPDNYFTVSALALSGDAYLLNEAKKIVMTTAAHIKPSGQVPRKIDNSYPTPQPIFDPFWSDGNGQWSPIMPIEIHWVLAALNCAKNDDDLGWLRALWPKIELATGFLLRMIQGPPHSCYNSIQSCPAPDPEACNYTEITLGIGKPGPPSHCGCSGGAPFVRGGGTATGGSHTELPYMLSTTGSLMNIPLRRGNFTSDTNIYMVHYLRELAAAYAALSQPKQSREMLAIATNISNAVNLHLWADAEDGDDHYITQLNHDGTTADYIDYAANTMAIWLGVANTERAKKIVGRMAKGNCTGAGKRGTWVSERPFYSFDVDKVKPDKQVYTSFGPAMVSYFFSSVGCPSTVVAIVNGVDGTMQWLNDHRTWYSLVWCRYPKLQGDSTSAEGRVALMDARARIAMGDTDSITYFKDNLLIPIQEDLLQYTWLTERYTCDGFRERTPFFFEYPCLLSIMLKEMKYGMDFGLTDWVLAPIPSVTPFHWSVGRTDVSHNGRLGPVKLSHPGSGTRQISVAGLTPGTKFVGTSGCSSRLLKVDGVTTTAGVARWNVSDIECGASVTLVDEV